MPTTAAPSVTPARFAPPPRRFCPHALDCGSVAALEPMFQELDARPLDGVAAIERFLADLSELGSLLSAERARRYIAMTRDTEDQAKRERYLAFERDVSPAIKTWLDRLDRRLLEAAATAQLSGDRYGLLLKVKRNQVEIFRPENTTLEAEEADLAARYGGLVGKMTVSFRGAERTLQQMSLFLEDNDRAVREAAWRAAAQRRAQDRAEIDRIFDQCLALRTRIAHNAGFADYVAFRFREFNRFDYTPADCERFHAAVESTVIPALRQLDRQRVARLVLDRLRPWDVEVDLENAPPVRSFTTEPELIAITLRLFRAVDPRFESEFAGLREQGLLDLMTRKGKQPGGYQYNLEDVRLPFIFANAAGKHDDVQTLLHEGGHAFHSLLSRDEPLLAYRDAPIEFAEVASMGMELLGLEHLGEVYPAGDTRVAYRGHLEGILRILPWITSIDAFQLWAYRHPQHTADERTAAWVAIRRRFAPTIDWTGLEDHLACAWQAQGHLFRHALYYIEYGIAQLGALQVWRNYRSDRRSAVDRYRAALALGGTRPLPELFAAAGLRFDMGSELMGDLVRELMTALAM